MRSLPRSFLLASCLTAVAPAAVFQGNGIKIGEVTSDSAVIWTRLTAAAEANWSGAPWLAPSLDGNREAAQAATDIARQSGMSEAAGRAEKAARKKAGDLTGAELRDLVNKADWRTQIAAGRSLADMQGTLPGAAGTVRVTLASAGGGAAVTTA